MPTKSNELLAVGLFGNRSNLRGRIERLLRTRRNFSPRASAGNFAAGVFALSFLTLAASLTPRWIAFAQQTPAFEIIAVKPNTADFRQVVYQVSADGKLTSKNISLLTTIATAYNVPFQSGRIKGAPDWVGRDRFDIEAAPPAGAFPSTLDGLARNAKLRLMMQALLADRFKLAIHSETKVMPVYAIVTGKGGPKLEKARVQEKDCPKTQAALGMPPGGDFSCHSFTGGQGRGLHGQAVDLSDLSLMVANWTDRPLVDKSGIQGLFHIETQPWIPMQPGPPPAPGTKGENGAEVADLPTIFGVFESLGLRLESQQAPVEYFVIDRVEKPDAN